MARRKPTWKCSRVQAGEKCGHENPNRKRKCEACGKERPPRKRAAHLSALRDFTYQDYIERGGMGEACNICGCSPKPGKRLHRDHDHRTGLPRSVLCFRCNTALRPYMTLAWLRAAVAYIERTSDA